MRVDNLNDEPTDGEVINEHQQQLLNIKRLAANVETVRDAHVSDSEFDGRLKELLDYIKGL